MPGSANFLHNLGVSAYPSWPNLSRTPALKTKGTRLDPTLRDDYENGMESSRAQYTRARREWDVTLEFLSPNDIQLLENFIEKTARFGQNIFIFPDRRDPLNPRFLHVRFSKLPSDTDTGWVEDAYRQTFTFSIREV